LSRPGSLFLAARSREKTFFFSPTDCSRPCHMTKRELNLLALGAATSTVRHTRLRAALLNEQECSRGYRGRPGARQGSLVRSGQESEDSRGQRQWRRPRLLDLAEAVRQRTHDPLRGDGRVARGPSHVRHRRRAAGLARSRRARAVRARQFASASQRVCVTILSRGNYVARVFVAECIFGDIIPLFGGVTPTHRACAHRVALAGVLSRERGSRLEERRSGLVVMASLAV
jgi:hypothetical protein